jgi:hypothetical protein
MKTNPDDIDGLASRFVWSSAEGVFGDLGCREHGWRATVLNLGSD